MDWLSILQQIFEVCLIPLLGIATTVLIGVITEKGKQIAESRKNELAKKYTTMLTETITNCVIATNQTYVEALKGKNAFTEEAQKEAFTRTYNAVIAILSIEAKTYLASIYGDLDKFITEQIEANVNLMKE